MKHIHSHTHTHTHRQPIFFNTPQKSSHPQNFFIFFSQMFYAWIVNKKRKKKEKKTANTHIKFIFF